MYLRINKHGNEQKKRVRGFSLIELMVSLTIFSILMVVSVGTLLTLIDANAKAQALSSATTNLSFAIDSITREIRTGHYYFCRKVATDGSGVDTLPDNATGPGTDCPDSTDANFIAFIRDRDNFKIGYRLQGKAIEQKILDSGSWERLTSDDVEIETFSIVTKDLEKYDETNTDVGQPVVTLHIKGKVKDNNGLETGTEFNIQTLIVQRRLDQV